MPSRGACEPEPDGVLFSGDIVMRPQPAFASPYSNLHHWLTSLDALELQALALATHRDLVPLLDPARTLWREAD